MRRPRRQMCNGNRKLVLPAYQVISSLLFLFDLEVIAFITSTPKKLHRASFLDNKKRWRQLPSATMPPRELPNITPSWHSPLIMMSSRMPSITPFTSLDVAIDKPILVSETPPLVSVPINPRPKVPAKSTSTLQNPQDGPSILQTLKKWISSLLASKVFRSAAIVFCAALVISLIFGSSSSLKGTWDKIQQRTRSKKYTEEEEEGFPMPFNGEEGEEGWGVCTLRAKRRLGKTDFVQYDFDLPEPDYYLPLDLGQEITLCCLDNNDNVAKGDFFPYTPKELISSSKLGVFTVLAPNRTPEENEYAIGKDAADFVRVLRTELKVGDEVALQPSEENKLSYRGQFLPVTDMVYIACGVGIVPVFDQIRNVLPNTSSSVRTVSIVWVNEDTKDFDIISDQLEQEYFKYSTKLAVSCIVDNLKVDSRSLHDNLEIDEAIPNFKPGTMAVLAGPEQIMEKSLDYLEDRGYPTDCICTL